MALLLDTCATIWIFEGQPVSSAAVDHIDRAIADAEPIYVSPVTAWELGLLVSRGRITLRKEPELWFHEVLQKPGIHVARLPTSVLVASSFLPGKPPKDPADRIFAATARAYGWRLVTRDRLLLDYAREGHIEALAC